MISITGGKFRGKKIDVPIGNQVRPTLNKIRQAIFNILQNLVELPEMQVLDLYAGSGVLGMEALSRGVQEAIFIEQDPKVFQITKKNVQSLSMNGEKVSVFCRTAHNWIIQFTSNEHPCLIFIDPPYKSKEYEKILNLISQLPNIPQYSTLVVESPNSLQYLVEQNLKMIKTKKYGQTKLCFFVKC